MGEYMILPYLQSQNILNTLGEIIKLHFEASVLHL